MKEESMRGPDLFLEIREALDLAGPLRPERKGTRKTINRLVSILEARVDDPRMRGKVSYPLTEVITLAFFAVLGGALTFQEIEAMCTYKEAYFRKFLPLKSGIPSHDTFCRVFSLIDMNQLNGAIVEFLVQSMDDLRKALGITKPMVVQLCVDGKEARGSGRKADASGNVTRNIQTLHVFSSYDGICLRSEQIDCKSNEIPKTPETLSTMDLKGTLVSFDALNTQKETIEVIISGKGDYIGGLKGNHKTLLDECEAYFTPEYLEETEDDPDLYYRTFEKAHGQTEECIYTLAKVVDKDNSFFSDWLGLNAIVRFEKNTEAVNTGEKTHEVRHYITSLDSNAAICGKAIREHWQVENSLHGLTDIIFGDDDNTTVNRRASGNLSLLKKMSVSLYRLMKPIDNVKTLSRVKASFLWAYEDTLERMLGVCDGKSIRAALENSLKTR